MKDLLKRLRGYEYPHLPILDEAANEIERLREFVKWVMKEGPWTGSSIDGADVQKMAELLGLVIEVPHDPLKHGECSIEPKLAWSLSEIKKWSGAE